MTPPINKRFSISPEMTQRYLQLSRQCRESNREAERGREDAVTILVGLSVAISVLLLMVVIAIHLNWLPGEQEVPGAGPSVEVFSEFTERSK